MNLIEWWRSVTAPRPAPEPSAPPQLVDDPSPVGHSRNTCPKCFTTAKEAKTRYRPAGRYPVEQVYVDVLLCRTVTECERPEHLLITCPCGFAWRERPRDWGVVA